MARKKWTHQEEVTDALLKLRERRKWQLAYRRYVLEGLPSESYAPYFGLDSTGLRNWFQLQFTGDMQWDNFGKSWQFGHIVPASYFDYANEADLYLCWNFINLRAERIDTRKTMDTVQGPIAVKAYFQALYDKTGFSMCMKMLDKLNMLESQNNNVLPALEEYLTKNKPDLEHISGLSKEDFLRYAQGTPVADILLEKEILRKFGSGQKP